MGMLTPYQYQIGQITGAHHISAAWMALLGLWASVTAAERQPYSLRWGGAALAWMSLAILNYPLGAMLYWAFLFPYILLRLDLTDAAAWKRLVKIAAPGIFAFPVPIIYAHIFGADHRSKLTHDLLGNLQSYFTDALPYSMSYWNIFLAPWQEYASLALIGLAAALAVVSGIRQETTARSQVRRAGAFAGKAIIVLGTLTLAYAPLLVLETRTMSTPRTFLAVKVAMLILCALSASYLLQRCVCRRSRQAAAVALSVIVVISATSTAHADMNTYFARPLYLEYNFLRWKLSVIDFSKPGPHVHIINAENPYQIDHMPVADEFGSTSTFWPRDTEYMVSAIAREMRMPLTFEDIANGRVTSGTRDYVVDVDSMQKKGLVPKGSIIIDMNDIRGLLAKPGGVIKAEDLSWVKPQN
jgi:hypothetical protein